MTPQGKRAILDQLMHYRRAKSYDDVLAVQEEWEALFQRYKEVATEPVPKDVLITAYSKILQEKLAADGAPGAEADAEACARVAEAFRAAMA